MNVAGPSRPGMFAVGGGTNAVLPFFSTSARFGVVLRSEGPAGFVFGVGVPLYFLSKSCVSLYLVAALSFSMVESLCFCKSFRWLCILEVRYS